VLLSKNVVKVLHIEEIKMKRFEQYCKKAWEMGIDRAKIIGLGSVITANWVTGKCQLRCPGLRKRLYSIFGPLTLESTLKVLDFYRNE
jgi:hypothetical protein